MYLVMSKDTLSKAPALLVSLSLLVFTISPTFAEDSITAAAVRPEPVTKAATTSGTTARPNLIQQKVEKERIAVKIADIKERIASKEAALKLRLQAFKDQRKATIAERVNTNLGNINQNQTTQMQKNLGTISSILDKLEARVNKAEPDIKDVAKARVAIVSARAAISTASAAVTVQSQKDYTITATLEGRIGLDVKTQRDKLHADLLSTRKLVIDAKQAVTNAIRIAKSGFRPIDGSESAKEKEDTNSGQQ